MLTSVLLDIGPYLMTDESTEHAWVIHVGMNSKLFHIQQAYHYRNLA